MVDVEPGQRKRIGRRGRIQRGSQKTVKQTDDERVHRNIGDADLCDQRASHGDRRRQDKEQQEGDHIIAGRSDLPEALDEGDHFEEIAHDEQNTCYADAEPGYIEFTGQGTL